MAAPTPTLSELAAQISSAAAAIDKHLISNNLPPTTFHEGGLLCLPHAAVVDTAKLQLLSLLSDMQLLVHSPG